MTATETETIEGVVVDDDQELQRVIDEATLHADATTTTDMIHIESRTGKGFLTIDPNQTEWTPTQLVQLRALKIETEGADAIPMPFVMHFLYLCQMRDLDPWLKEAYLITHGKRWYSREDQEWVDNREFTTVTAIDGFRKRSEDTGQYLGTTDAEWIGKDGVWRDFWDVETMGVPLMARVGVVRRGNPMPIYGKAAYAEFVPMVDEYAGTGKQRHKTGKKIPTPMWRKMPTNQLAKCAEAQGHRKAFPRQQTGMVAPEEMDRAKVEYEVEQASEQRRAVAERVQQAHSARATADSEAPGAQPARAGEPVHIGDATRVAVDKLRESARVPQPNARAPRGDSRAPASALGAQEPASESARLGWLREEITWLAREFGITEQKLCARQVAALDKPIGEFTVDELVVAVQPFRAQAVRRLNDTGRPDQAAAYETAPKGAVMPLNVLLGISAAEATAAVDYSQPHAYVEAGGVCEGCGSFEDEPIHRA